MRGIKHMNKDVQEDVEESTCTTKKHVKKLLQVCRHSHNVTDELHHFKQIIEEPVSSNVDE